MFFKELHLHIFAYNVGKYLEARQNLMIMTKYTPSSNHIIATCVGNFASKSQTITGHSFGSRHLRKSEPQK